MATAKSGGGGTKVQVVNTFDPENIEWTATSRSPKLSVRGLNASQSLDRMNSLLRKHFDGADFEIVERLVLPQALQDRVDDFGAKTALSKQLAEELDALRVPLARDLQKIGVMQRTAAEVVGLSPTWLANLSRQFDSDPNNRRSK